MRSIIILGPAENWRADFCKELHLKGYSIQYIGITSPFLFSSIHENSAIILWIDKLAFDYTSLTRELKSRFEKSPLIVYQREKDDYQSAVCFSTGADEVIDDGQTLHERIIRVDRMIHLYEKLNAVAKQIEEVPRKYIAIGNYTLLPEEFSIMKNGQTLELTVREFKFLMYMYRERSRVVSREEIVKEWQTYFPKASSNPRTADILISKVRNKLKLSKSSAFQIATVRNQGYTFKINSEFK